MRRVLAVIGVGAVLAFAGCGGDDEEQPAAGGAGTTTEESTPTPTPTPTPTATPEGGGTASASAGKQTFTTTCGGCHTLADAGTNGKVGPVLDDIKPDKQRVLNAIETGPGAMPDGLLQGADADAVAEYVSSVAGKS